MRIASLLLVSVIAALGCTDSASGPDDEWGMDGPVEPTPPPGKEDSEYRRGLLVATDTSRTQAWAARNKWEDRTTPAARAAGMAWPADSGLSWDEKYAKWIESMEWVPAADNYSTTINITTPWGKTMASPYLECAEMAMFLRITFAAWYELPLQWEAVDAEGVRIFFGHFGVRTAAGRYARTPEFAIAYKDYTSSDWQASWPTDATLRTRKLYGGTDEQRQMGEGAVFGTFLDEIHVNKRAAYFTALTINYLGSVNLADTANTYNLVPDAIRSGDVLVERWQRVGIGHTLIVKEITPIGEGSLDVAMISGSMPRRQGVRTTGAGAKNYFTSNYTGGVGEDSDGVPYAKLGGGIKRWRVTKNIDGYWTNTWMSGDEAHWINSTDYERISARPAQFETLLGEVPPEQQRDQLLTVIADARHHLSQYPASCSARERRETAFRELYALSAREFGQSTAEVDAAYRKLEDRVLGELEYAASKTCCWNSSTAAMYEIIMSYAEAEQAEAAANSTCIAPTVFRSRADGYATWAAHAESLGRGAQWRAWSEDETCDQRDVAEDTEAASEATPFCTAQ